MNHYLYLAAIIALKLGILGEIRHSPEKGMTFHFRRRSSTKPESSRVTSTRIPKC